MVSLVSTYPRRVVSLTENLLKRSLKLALNISCIPNEVFNVSRLASPKKFFLMYEAPRPILKALWDYSK
jgi:hypothetical protein